MTLQLPITQTARRIAQLFASQQPTPQKAEQVRLNTLAVCVVNDYLQLMGIPCNPSASDSWNPVVRLCADTADLEVTGVGRLECRPLLIHEQICQIPPEVWLDRIGYVMVQIDNASLEAAVLGFAQTAVVELPINQLQPVESLLDHLNQLMHPVASPSAVELDSTGVNLNQWFQNIFEAGWQAVEELLNPAEANRVFRFRSPESAVTTGIDATNTGIKRAKLINLGMQLAGYPVALIVELTPASEYERNIILQLCPTGSQSYLPPLLQLIVLDDKGLIFLEAQARNTDGYVQLEFSGILGEQFSVEVTLGDASITTDFII